MLEPARIRSTSSMDRFFSSASRLCEGGEQRRARGVQRRFGLGRLVGDYGGVDGAAASSRFDVRPCSIFRKRMKKTDESRKHIPWLAVNASHRNRTVIGRPAESLRR